MDGYPVHVTLPVQWGDLDALGHVNNTRYFTWFESARIALFERVGLANTGADLTVGPLLATTTCDFLRPLHYPDTVVVGARVSRMGNTSFTMEYAVERTAEPGVVVARGSGVIVTVDYRAGVKVRVPQATREAIAALS